MTKNQFQDNHEIFLKTERALEWLETEEILKKKNKCTNPECERIEMKLYKKKCCLDGVYLKCTVCNRRSNLPNFLNIGYPAIPIRQILFILYLSQNNLNNIQIMEMTGISENSIIKVKRTSRKSLEDKLIRAPAKIGGPGFSFQVDETACNRKALIRNSTTLQTEVRWTKWVIGIICEQTGQSRLAVLPDRTVGSFYDFFERHIKTGSLIKSDSYPSYQEAVRRAGCQHQQVNHSRGFVAPDGTHTNTIEALWAGLKLEIKKRGGVMFSHLKEFIVEYGLKLELKNMFKHDTYLKFKMVSKSLHHIN